MTSVKSGPLTSATRLFIVTAAIELGAGLMLLAAPAVVVRLLFGPAVDVFPAVGIARLTGAALLSLGAACWWALHEERSAASRALIGAMLIYNTAVVVLAIVGALGALVHSSGQQSFFTERKRSGALGSWPIDEGEDRLPVEQ